MEMKLFIMNKEMSLTGKNQVIIAIFKINLMIGKLKFYFFVFFIKR